jgi:exonuclease V gamma subunit
MGAGRGRSGGGCAPEAGDGAPHTGNRLQRLIETLQRAESGGGPGDAPHGLPSRVTVFGVSTLPPLFVDLLFAIARHRPVTVYSAALEVAASHPLALAYGGQSREFVAELEGRGAAVQRVGEVPNGAGVLARLQRELATDDAGTTPLELAWSDDSLRVHDAHGAMRQLEVVRDQLLAALAADDTLRPHDLLLLVPDAAEWAPTVDAVFGVSVQGAPRLPYRIADRPLRRAQPAAEALARLLSLEGGRLERSAMCSRCSRSHSSGRGRGWRRATWSGSSRRSTGRTSAGDTTGRRARRSASPTTRRRAGARGSIGCC